MKIISDIWKKKVFPKSLHKLILKCAAACDTTGKMSNEMDFSYDPTEYMNMLSSTCRFFNLPFFLSTNKRFITSRNCKFYRQEASQYRGYLIHDASSIETRRETNCKGLKQNKKQLVYFAMNYTLTYCESHRRK